MSGNKQVNKNIRQVNSLSTVKYSCMGKENVSYGYQHASTDETCSKQTKRISLPELDWPDQDKKTARQTVADEANQIYKYQDTTLECPVQGIKCVDATPIHGKKLLRPYNHYRSVQTNNKNIVQRIYKNNSNPHIIDRKGERTARNQNLLNNLETGKSFQSYSDYLRRKYGNM